MVKAREPKTRRERAGFVRTEGRVGAYCPKCSEPREQCRRRQPATGHRSPEAQP